MTGSILNTARDIKNAAAAEELKKSDFSFKVPPDLIAQRPLPSRTESRLLCLDGESGIRHDRRFADLPALLNPGDLLVLNDTRVVNARLIGRKESGGKVEVLIERIQNCTTARAQLRASNTPVVGGRLNIDDAVVQVISRHDDLFELLFHDLDCPLSQWLEQHGNVPLPPYIEREPVDDDRQRYQTVYARRPGAVAAPTAGLHFDAALLEKLQACGIDHAFVTLHVGAGTFQPVRVERLSEHRMHREQVTVTAATCDKIAATRRHGGRVIAVGTTSVRSLEVAFREGCVQPFSGMTDLFIYPGYRFNTVDALVTNFHLPESTLLMLVCAFAGTAQVMAAYRHAIARRYRFFSYGDAMFITRGGNA